MYICRPYYQVKEAINGTHDNSEEILAEVIKHKEHYVAVLNARFDDMNNTVNLYAEMFWCDKFELFKELISEINYDKSIYDEYNILGYLLLRGYNVANSNLYLEMIVSHIIENDLSFTSWSGQIIHKAHKGGTIYFSETQLLSNITNKSLGESCLNLLHFSDKNIPLNSLNDIFPYFKVNNVSVSPYVITKSCKDYFENNGLKYNDLRNNFTRFLYVLSYEDIPKLEKMMLSFVSKAEEGGFFKYMLAKMEAQSLSEDFNGINKGKVLKI